MINAPLPHKHFYNEHDLTDAYHSRVWVFCTLIRLSFVSNKNSP